MKLLLDTHIWLWSLLEPGRLTPRVVKALRAPENSLWLSPISVWEARMLVEKKRVHLDAGFDGWFGDSRAAMPLNEAPLTFEVAVETGNVRLGHRDPADHFLVATARVFALTLVTADQRLRSAKAVSILAN